MNPLRTIWTHWIPGLAPALLAGSIAVCLGGCSNAPPRHVPAAHPNVIVILVDDLGYGDVNLGIEGIDAFQNPYIKTPNLAALAAEGLVLTHHYAAAPVCSPSRAGLLTGRTPARHNIHLYIRDLLDNERYFLHGEEVTIAETLKQAGYRTAVFGKWHLNGADWEDRESWTGWTGSYPKQQGFDQGIVSKENPHYTRELQVNTQQVPGDFFDLEGRPLGPLKGYTTDIITDRAIEWIGDGSASEQPFFLYLPYDAVHVRVAAPDRFLLMYDTGDPRKDMYFANVSHLDEAIGRLLLHLERASLADDTIVVFTSDNGPDVLNRWEATYFCYGVSYPLNGQKYQLFEGGIRVPGIVRWPGMIEPRVSHEPNSTLDLLPTFADIAEVGIPTDRTIDGASLKDLWLADSPVQRTQPLYWQYENHRTFQYVGEGYDRRFDNQLPELTPPDRPNTVIRDGDYVLRGFHSEQFSVPERFELYNIVEDPGEETELSATEPGRLREMKAALLAIYADVASDSSKTKQAITDRRGSIRF